MKFSLRRLCTHMLFDKNKLYDTYLYRDRENYELQEQYCKEHLYEAVKENVEYFRKFNLCKMSVIVSAERLLSMNFDKVYELKENYNKAVVGIFGKTFDNCTSILMEVDEQLFTYNIYKQRDRQSVVWKVYITTIKEQEVIFLTNSRSDKLSDYEIKEIMEQAKNR